MQNAVTVWTSDLTFVNNLNKENQKKVYSKNTALIYKGKNNKTNNYS